MPSLTRNAVADVHRRRFLQLMGASLALASGACSGPPPEHIVPYVDSPPDLADASPLFYASAFTLDGYAYGVLVETSMGRAIKIEGNPQHPASLGGTNVYAQASVLELWDPERSQAVYARDQVSTWQACDAALAQRLAALENKRGEGLRVLTTNVTSPTLIAQLGALEQRLPHARWHAYDPLANDNARAGDRVAFGRNVDCVYAFDRARVVLDVDADVLGSGPGSLRYAHDFMRRRSDRDADRASRLYALESTPGLTGAVADERLALAPQEIERALWRIAARLGAAPSGVYSANASTAKWEAAVAKALSTARGEAIVVAGSRLSPETRGLVHRLNAELGAVGATLRYIDAVAANANGVATIAELASDMNAGRVDTLVVLGGNPAYDAPANLDFEHALENVALSLHLGLHRDETARACTWHTPKLHEYEAWSDARAFDGTATVIQPAMRPLYPARSAHDVLARLVRAPRAEPLALVRATWRERLREGADGEDQAWRAALRRGTIDNTAARALDAPRLRDFSPPRLDDAPIVAVFVPDARTHDGAYANNAWLQELPHPITSLVWDNAALLSAATARSLNVRAGDVLRVRSEGRAIEAPAWICGGHADGVVTLPLGRGRRAAGSIGNDVGFDAYRLRTTANSRGGAVSVDRVAGRHIFVARQKEDTMQGRDLVRYARLRDFLRNPQFASDEPRERVPGVSLYPPYEYPEYAWGMAIDLNACIGCGACTIACQAENNIPVVGKEQAALGREMHWIRVDRYYDGPHDKPRTHFQPVPCMHCENAPCEEVCPVGATVHDSEGLNVQVYNRCVGTRFCSQNCPYKVRRFNFLQYSALHDPGLEAVHNPEVTVRQRGVMEKCTYCVQRVTRGRIEAEKAGRRIRDGEVVTACQAVCPTKAITFGDLNDETSAVRRMKASPLNYALLSELNTRPRTTYLAKVINSDPDVA